MSTPCAVLSMAGLPGAVAPKSHSPQTHDLLNPLRGPSPAMGRLWSQIKWIAPHLRTLLLTGEPNCGQESVVHLLQIHSPFLAGPLLTLNAAEASRRLASPKCLLQSVAGGVLYLPDVDLLSAEAQVDLLRFLRLNRHQLAALVASAGRDLRSLAAANAFLPDLAHMLSLFHLAVPPLRERREDIPLLAELFLREAEALVGRDTPLPPLSPEFLHRAASLEWTGNLDQLRSVIQHLAESAGDLNATAKPHPILQRSGTPAFGTAELQAALAHVGRSMKSTEPTATVRLVKLDDIVQEHIRSVLVACQGNKLRASEVLGISRSTLYRMLECDLPTGFVAAQEGFGLVI